MPELFHLYTELYKSGAYFYRHPQNPALHLIVIDKPRVNILHEFGVPEVRRQLLLHSFGSETLQQTLAETELFLRQLPVIQYRGKKALGILPEV